MTSIKKIMLGIIANGGLYGRCALFYFDDPLKSEQFIIECSEQCHHPAAIRMWGQGLVNEIKMTAFELKRQKRKQIDYTTILRTNDDEHSKF